jgi:hypothetical protein
MVSNGRLGLSLLWLAWLGFAMIGNGWLGLALLLLLWRFFPLLFFHFLSLELGNKHLLVIVI